MITLFFSSSYVIPNPDLINPTAFKTSPTGYLGDNSNHLILSQTLIFTAKPAPLATFIISLDSIFILRVYRPKRKKKWIHFSFPFYLIPQIQFIRKFCWLYLKNSVYIVQRFLTTSIATYLSLRYYPYLSGLLKQPSCSSF